MLDTLLRAALICYLLVLLGACATPAEAPTSRPADPAAGATAPSHPALARELVAMEEEDQRRRQELNIGGDDDPAPALVSAIRTADAVHTKRLVAIIESLGHWPGTKTVGLDGAQAAWLLAQHADHDPAAQRFFLKHLRTAVDQGLAPGKHLAYLVDRVRLKDGKPQVYGTQFDITDGELRLKPVADPASLDARRARVGLEPIEVYLERSRQIIFGDSRTE